MCVCVCVLGGGGGLCANLAKYIEVITLEN